MFFILSSKDCLRYLTTTHWSYVLCTLKIAKRLIHVHQALSANIFLPFPLSECVETSEIIVYSQDIMVRFFIDQLTLLSPCHTLPHSTLFLIFLETDFCETVPKKLEEQISSQLIPGETENENKETEPFFSSKFIMFLFNHSLMKNTVPWKTCQFTFACQNLFFAVRLVCFCSYFFMLSFLALYSFLQNPDGISLGTDSNETVPKKPEELIPSQLIPGET